MTAARLNHNGVHEARSFKKVETTIASEEAVSAELFNQFIGERVQSGLLPEGLPLLFEEHFTHFR
jgi:hypothetical protein